MGVGGKTEKRLVDNWIFAPTVVILGHFHFKNDPHLRPITPKSAPPPQNEFEKGGEGPVAIGRLSN